MLIDVQGHWDWQLTKENLQSLGVPGCGLPNQGLEKYDRVRLKKHNVAQVEFSLFKGQILYF